MKKIFLICFLFSVLFIPQTNLGQVLQVSFDIRAGRLITDGFNIANRNITNHIFTWSIQQQGATAAVLSACTLLVQTSFDNINWITQSTQPCTSGGSTGYLVFVANYIRLNASVYTINQGIPILTVTYAGYVTSPLNNFNITNTTFVQWWGAVGDGIHDDSVAIKAAINSLPASGGIVNFPPGNYLVSGQGANNCAIQVKSNIWLQGTGYNSHIKLANSQTTFTRVITDCNVPVSYVKISDLRIDGNVAGNPLVSGQKHCIFFGADGITPSHDINVTNTYVHDCEGDAIFYHLTNNSIIDHNFIWWTNYTMQPGRVGINCDGCNYSTVSTNIIHDITLNWCMKMEESDPSIFTANNFINNNCYNNGGGISLTVSPPGALNAMNVTGNNFEVIPGSSPGINMAGVYGATVSTNITSGGSAGFACIRDCYSTSLIGNYFGKSTLTGAGNGGISFGASSGNPATDITINGNTIDGNAGVGIMLRPNTNGGGGAAANRLQRFIVAKNTIKNNVQGGIEVDGLDNIDIADNIFSGNTSYGIILATLNLGTYGSNHKVNIHNNSFINLAAGPQTIGITLADATAATDLITKDNIFDNITTPLQNYYNGLGTYFVDSNIGVAAPTCSGAGCAIVANSTQFVGKVTTTTTGAATITVTFNQTGGFAFAPVCIAVNETTSNLVRVTSSTTTTMILNGTTVNGDTLSWICRTF